VAVYPSLGIVLTLNPPAIAELQLVQRQADVLFREGVHVVHQRRQFGVTGMGDLPAGDAHSQGPAVMDQVAAVERVMADRLDLTAGGGRLETAATAR